MRTIVGSVFAALALMVAIGAPATAHAQTLPPQSGDAATVQIARDYLEAYQELDTERLATMYADDVVFYDPTSFELEGMGAPFLWVGRDEVLARLGDWRRSVAAIPYEIERVYEAAGRVVFVGAVLPAMRTSGGLATYRYSIVTIVSVRGGKIVEHRDYTNYAGGVRVGEDEQ